MRYRAHIHVDSGVHEAKPVSRAMAAFMEMLRVHFEYTA